VGFGVGGDGLEDGNINSWSSTCIVSNSCCSAEIIPKSLELVVVSVSGSPGAVKKYISSSLGEDDDDDRDDEVPTHREAQGWMGPFTAASPVVNADVVDEEEMEAQTAARRMAFRLVISLEVILCLDDRIVLYREQSVHDNQFVCASLSFSNCVKTPKIRE